MRGHILKLEIENYKKCSAVWDMEKDSQLAERFYNELLSGNRITYVYAVDDEYAAEISLVYDMNDSDYTIPDKRAYVSRLIVKPEYRRKGIGKTLVDFIKRTAAEQGFSELSIGVDIDNYPALKLYVEAGFEKIIYIGQDEQGRYVKLLGACPLR